MSTLLDMAMDAHGGRTHWQAVRSISARISVSGALFAMRGHAETLRDTAVTVDVARPRATFTDIGAPGQRGVFEAERVFIETDTGEFVAERKDPRAAGVGQPADQPWDHLQLLYFTGYAMWNYLNCPFLLAQPGIEAEELAPWDEEGQRWRRLKVTFPATVPTHCAEQTYYFNEDGKMRRLDYTPEPAGGLARPAAHYCLDDTTVAGLVFPTRRRVYMRKGDGTPHRAMVAVSLDVADIQLG